MTEYEAPTKRAVAWSVFGFAIVSAVPFTIGYVAGSAVIATECKEQIDEILKKIPIEVGNECTHIPETASTIDLSKDLGELKRTLKYINIGVRECVPPDDEGLRRKINKCEDQLSDSLDELTWLWYDGECENMFPEHAYGPSKHREALCNQPAEDK